MADQLREALEKIRRMPEMPFPDRGAHSERAFANAVWTAWSRIQQIADAALSAPPQEIAKEVMPTEPEGQNDGIPVTLPGVESGSGQECAASERVNSMTITSWLELTVECSIHARSQRVQKALARVARHYYADVAEPTEYCCKRCHCQWDDSPTRNPQEVTCSNCYSENITIAKVRLTFHNWGEQNGGEPEMRERYEFAKRRIREGGEE